MRTVSQRYESKAENVNKISFEDIRDTLFPFPRKCIQSCIRLLQTFYITLHDLYTNISKYLKDVCWYIAVTSLIRSRFTDFCVSIYAWNAEETPVMYL